MRVSVFIAFAVVCVACVSQVEGFGRLCNPAPTDNVFPTSTNDVPVNLKVAFIGGNLSSSLLFSPSSSFSSLFSSLPFPPFLYHGMLLVEDALFAQSQQSKQNKTKQNKNRTFAPCWLS